MSKVTYEHLVSLLRHLHEIMRERGNDRSLPDLYILELLYLKRISDLDESGNHSLVIPDEARWNNILNVSGNYGSLINNALHAIEQNNPSTWEGELTRNNFYNGDFFGDQFLYELIRIISAISLRDEDLEKPDIIGRAVQNYIERVMGGSLRGGEYWTSTSLSTLVISLLNLKSGMSIADPVVGTGNILIEAAKYVKLNGGDPLSLILKGQDLRNIPALLAKLCLFFYNLPYGDIKVGDSLSNPRILIDGKMEQFDRVIADIPLGGKDLNDSIEEHDPYNRYIYGHSPKSRREYKFIQHAIAMTKPDGITAIITSQGVLFRGASESEIRKKMVDADIIEAIITLPSGITPYTNVPLVILIFNKSKSLERKGKILFVNGASRKLERKSGMKAEDSAAIRDAYNSFTSVLGFSYVTSTDEIASQEYNLNVSLYIEESVNAEYIDINENIQELEKLQDRRKIVMSNFFDHYRKLGYNLPKQ